MSRTRTHLRTIFLAVSNRGRHAVKRVKSSVRYQAEGCGATTNKLSATTASPHFVKRAVPHAVNVLSSISICVLRFRIMHAAVCACACVCVRARAFTRLGTGRLLTHFELFSFFIHSPRAATRLLLSLSFLFSASSRSPPSIYLVIIVT